MGLNWNVPTSIHPWLNKLFPRTTESSSWRYNVTIATGTTAGIAAVWYLWKRYQDRGLPPGPTGFPLLGAVHLISEKTFHSDLGTLSKKYGDVFSIQLGRSLMIILASHSAVKEAFLTQGDTFGCRPENSLMEIMELKDDIFSTPYQTEGWKENKSFLLRCLRGAGFGITKSAEDKILEQVELLSAYIETLTEGGNAIRLRDVLPKAAVNVLFQILFGKKFDFTEPRLDEVQKVIKHGMEAFLDVSVLDNAMPNIIVKTWFRKKLASIVTKINELKAMTRSEVEEHIQNYNPDNLCDFVDLYFSKKGKEHCIERIVDNVLTFTPDACDTLPLIMEWIFLYITYHPPVQERLIKEIDALTKGNRHVIWEDRKHIPYIEAVICEVLRLSSPVPISAPHAVSKEVIFRGFRIPTTAKIFALFSHVHRDPVFYPDPDAFKPERFLDPDGNLIKTDHLMPFSMGCRKCPGEQIAQIEMFLFVANLIQSFQFSFCDDDKISLEWDKSSDMGHPQEFKVILKRRL